MTVIATASNPNFSVSRFEIEKEGSSYTIETLKAMRAAYPSSEIFFITGADAVLEILTWREPEKLFEYSRFIAATRPGFDIDKIKRVGRFRVTKSGSGEEAEIYVMEIPALSISSTEIRQRIGEGKPVRYLIPDGVLEYIIQRELYHGHAIPRQENIR
jgi:nicotinate-nucleotide adenylyltransferase